MPGSDQARQDGEVSTQSDLLGSKFVPKCGDDASYSSKRGAHNQSTKIACKSSNLQDA